MKASSEARRFVLQAVQDWGQTEESRIASVQDVLNLAGFDAKATCGPVFGGIWPRECGGKDGKAASAFLQHLTDTMPRGKFERECEHVDKCLQEHKEAA